MKKLVFIFITAISVFSENIGTQDTYNQLPNPTAPILYGIELEMLQKEFKSAFETNHLYNVGTIEDYALHVNQLPLLDHHKKSLLEYKMKLDNQLRCYIGLNKAIRFTCANKLDNQFLESYVSEHNFHNIVEEINNEIKNSCFCLGDPHYQDFYWKDWKQS